MNLHSKLLNKPKLIIEKFRTLINSEPLFWNRVPNQIHYVIDFMNNQTCLSAYNKLRVYRILKKIDLCKI